MLREPSYVPDPPIVPSHGAVSIPDQDYYLRDGCGWFEYNGLVVRIFHNEKLNCLEVLTFPTGHEDEEPLSYSQVCYQRDSD